MNNLLRFFKKTKVEKISKVNRLDIIPHFNKLNSPDIEEIYFTVKEMGDPKYNELIALLEVILMPFWAVSNSLANQQPKSALDEFDYENDGYAQYCADYPGTRAEDLLREVIRGSGYPRIPITWSFKIKGDMERNDVSFNATVIDSETWELIELCAKETKLGLQEGGKYKAEFKPNLDELYLPQCNAGPYISETLVIADNMIDANCDCNGTIMGAQAQRLYSFYIEDLDVFGLLKFYYYVL